MKKQKRKKKLKKKPIRNTRKKRGKNNHNNKGKKKMNNKVIKPFITRGSIVGTNGDRKVVMNKDGISPSQLDWVYGFEKTITETLDKIEEYKGEKIKDNYLTYCFWKDDKDYYGSLMVDLENENEIDEIYEDLICLFNGGVKKGDFIPTDRFSQRVETEITDDYQIEKNNEWIKMRFDTIKDGGYLIIPNSGMILMKDESRNGWVVINENNTEKELENEK